METLIRTPRACVLAGVSYRQIDYWLRTGRLRSTIEAKGSGSQRLFNQRAVEVAWALGQSSTGGPQRVPDLHRLHDLERFSGWLVLHEGGSVVCADSDELAWELALWPAAHVINLDLCPVAERLAEKEALV